MSLRDIHKQRLHAEKMVEFLKFLERQALTECRYYYFDSASCEDYCYLPRYDKPCASIPLDGKALEICSKCEDRESG